jgi:phosphate/sulfate permease
MTITTFAALVGALSALGIGVAVTTFAALAGLAGSTSTAAVGAVRVVGLVASLATLLATSGVTGVDGIRGLGLDVSVVTAVGATPHGGVVATPWGWGDLPSSESESEQDSESL